MFLPILVQEIIQDDRSKRNTHESSTRSHLSMDPRGDQGHCFVNSASRRYPLRQYTQGKALWSCFELDPLPTDYHSSEQVHLKRCVQAWRPTCNKRPINGE